MKSIFGKIGKLLDGKPEQQRSKAYLEQRRLAEEFKRKSLPFTRCCKCGVPIQSGSFCRTCELEAMI